MCCCNGAYIKKGACYVQVPYGSLPVGNFSNPGLLPIIFLTLFPFGLGGCEDHHQSCPLSLQRHVKHFFNLSDTHFQTHYSFMFMVFNLLQCRQILLYSSLKVNCHTFDAFKVHFTQVSPTAMQTVAEHLLKGDNNSNFTFKEMCVQDLLKQVTHITTHVQGANSAWIVMHNQIHGLMIKKGLSSFYVILNPANMYSPIVKFLAGSNINIDNMLADNVPSFWLQSILVANNPAIYTKFFQIYMEAFIHTLLRFDPSGLHTTIDSPVGVLGQVSAYYGCVEAQGRGSLHCHMIIWLVDALNLNKIKDWIVQDSMFTELLLAVLEDCIATSIPNDPLPDKDILSSLFHPSSVCMPSLDLNESYTCKQLQKDLHFLVDCCQTH